jgi:phosphoribosylamine--glycine ligase
LRAGDTGPNTGGMGAYSPAPVVDWRAMQTIRERVLEPCVAGLAKQGEPYTGVLYAGLMMTADGPKVVEFNCRFGDPETQALLPRLKTDLAPVLMACCDGTLDRHTLEWDESFCVSVALVSGGYPGDYEKGAVIEGITAAEEGGGAVVFHAGTKLADGKIVTNGGRVLNVTCSAPSIVTAIENAYAAVKKVRFDHMYFRSDIGQKARRHFS